MSATRSSAFSTTGRAAGRASALLAAAAGALIGLAVLWGVGFAGAGVLHSAAHDARHANGFPCH